MTIKLLALDLDGTLFNSQKEISPDNRRAIAKARERGIKVVITTGRPLKAIGSLLDDLDLVSEDQYCITFNGGLVQKTTGEVLHQSGLTYEELVLLYQMFEAVGLPLDIISEDLVYSLPSQGNYSQYHTANPLLTFVELEDISELPRDQHYYKVVSVYDQDFLDRQLKRLPASLWEDFEAFKSREIIFEVMPKGTHKAAGLAVLAEKLAISPTEMMAMGDEENDLTMLTYVGLGVAMKNAVPTLKQAARFVSEKGHEESGVAWAIDRYLLKEEDHGLI